MAQPTPYVRSFDFTGFQEQYPDQALPAAPIDSNLDTISIAVSQIINRMSIIQRDDGKLANQSVGLDTLANTVRVLLGTPVDPRGEWQDGVEYKKLDLVTVNGTTYICAINHTSGEIFADDLEDGYWVLFSNPSIDTGETFFQKFSGDGENTTFTLTDDLGTDVKALMVFYNSGSYFEIVDPDLMTLDGTELELSFAPVLDTDNLWVFAPYRLLGAVAAAAANAESFATAAEGARNQAVAARDSILNNAGFIAVSADLDGANNIGAVAGKLTEIEDLGAIAGAIGALGSIADKIEIVADNNSNVYAVGQDLLGDNTIGDVAGAITNINLLAASMDNINLVVGAKDNIDLLGPIAEDIEALGPVAGDLSFIAENFATIEGLLEGNSTILESFLFFNDITDVPDGGVLTWIWGGALITNQTSEQSALHTELDYSLLLTNGSDDVMQLQTLEQVQTLGDFSAIAVDCYVENDGPAANVRVSCGLALKEIPIGQSTQIITFDESGGFNSGVNFMVFGNDTPSDPVRLYISNLRGITPSDLGVVANAVPEITEIVENMDNIDIIAEWIDDGMPGGGTPSVDAYSFFGNDTGSTATGTSINTGQAKWMLGLPAFTTQNHLAQYSDAFGNMIDSAIEVTGIGRIRGFRGYMQTISTNVYLDAGVYPSGTVIRADATSTDRFLYLAETATVGDTFDVVKFGTNVVEFVTASGATLMHPDGHNKIRGEGSRVNIMCTNNVDGNSAIWNLCGDTST